MQKVRASTIIEVLISMIVIMVVFGIAMLIFANVTRSGVSEKKVRSSAVLQQILLDDERTTDLASRTFTVDSLRIEQQVKNYNGQGSLVEIDLRAYDTGGQLTAETHKIIPAP
jgi:type II secretory pathway pseudopilin PulG